MKREINLITEEFIFDPLQKIKWRLAAGWLVLFIAGFAGIIVSKSLAIQKGQAELVRLNSHLAELSKEEQDLVRMIQQNNAGESDASFKNTINWMETLSLIGSLVPEGAWLSSLEGGVKVEGNGQPVKKEIKLAGFASSHGPITLLLSRMERQPVFSQIRLIYTQKGETADDHYIHFEMTGNLN